MCVCVCVCVCEREGEEGEGANYQLLIQSEPLGLGLGPRATVPQYQHQSLGVPWMLIYQHLTTHTTAVHSSSPYPSISHTSTYGIWLPSSPALSGSSLCPYLPASICYRRPEILPHVHEAT